MATAERISSRLLLSLQLLPHINGPDAGANGHSVMPPPTSKVIIIIIARFIGYNFCSFSRFFLSSIQFQIFEKKRLRETRVFEWRKILIFYDFYAINSIGCALCPSFTQTKSVPDFTLFQIPVAFFHCSSFFCRSHFSDKQMRAADNVVAQKQDSRILEKRIKLVDKNWLVDLIYGFSLTPQNTRWP